MKNKKKQLGKLSFKKSTIAGLESKVLVGGYETNRFEGCTIISLGCNPGDRTLFGCPPTIGYQCPSESFCPAGVYCY